MTNKLTHRKKDIYDNIMEDMQNFADTKNSVRGRIHTYRFLTHLLHEEELALARMPIDSFACVEKQKTLNKCVTEHSKFCSQFLIFVDASNEYIEKLHHENNMFEEHIEFHGCGMHKGIQLDIALKAETIRALSDELNMLCTNSYLRFDY